MYLNVSASTPWVMKYVVLNLFVQNLVSKLYLDY